jgi:hypothetical protein
MMVLSGGLQKAIYKNLTELKNFKASEFTLLKILKELIPIKDITSLMIRCITMIN